MHIKSVHTEKNANHKMETKMNSLSNSYVNENRKNSSQETEQTLGAEDAKGTSSILSSTSISKKVWLGAAVLIVVLASVGVVVSLASSSLILQQLGFTSKGVASKSFASRLMSSTSKANNHTVPQDSWVSWLQKAGQKGLTVEHQAYFATGGAIAGVMVSVVVVAVALAASSALRCYKQQQSSVKDRTA